MRGFKRFSVFFHSRNTRRFARRLALVAGISLALTIGYVLWTIRDLPSPAAFAEREIPQTTRILDREGTVQLYGVFGQERRRVVGLHDISPDLVNATVTTEDDQFFHHIGIDFAGIVRSVLRNILARRFEEGGSTITQQLVRNAVLTTEQTVQRKVKEIVLSLELELKYSKEQILEAYLNQITYGSNIYGVEAASEAYFGKSARDISLSQATILAALPKAPSFYSPWGSHQEELLARRNYVLDRMQTLGYINAEQNANAKKETLVFQPPRADIKAPHFVFFMREELERLVGKDLVERGGLTVTTTLDWKIQRIAEEEVTKAAIRNENRWGGKNAALVAVDPKTGEILAMVGSRDYFDAANDGNVNVAVRQRQPGSSFKPVVYAAAFERGFTANTILFDLETQFAVGSAKSYAPKDYDGRVRGPVTARQALSNSLNIPAVKILYLVGIDRALNLAARLGFTTLTKPDTYGLSLVLGGGAVTLLEETSAFSVFANDGIRAPASSILSIKDASGKVIFERRVALERVLDAEVTRTVSDILSDNPARALVFGTNSPLTLGTRPAAAKTGTNQDFRDGWTIGYTPSFALGVWVGNNDNSSMHKGADGVVVAAPIWNAVMKRVLEGKPVENFIKPKPQKIDKPILDGVFAVEERVLLDRASGKRATDRTPPEWIEEHVYRTIHDTLFWVDRKNPQGPAPKDPYQDPQFVSWEAAVQAWIAQNPELALSTAQRPPEEYDDIHTEQNTPLLSVFEPQEGTHTSNPLIVSALASAPLGIAQVLVFIDGEYLGPLGLESNKKQEGFWRGVFFLPHEADLHALTLKAFDVYGNRQERSVTVEF